MTTIRKKTGAKKKQPTDEEQARAVASFAASEQADELARNRKEIARLLAARRAAQLTARDPHRVAELVYGRSAARGPDSLFSHIAAAFGVDWFSVDDDQQEHPQGLALAALDALALDLEVLKVGVSDESIVRTATLRPEVVASVIARLAARARAAHTLALQITELWRSADEETLPPEALATVEASLEGSGAPKPTDAHARRFMAEAAHNGERFGSSEHLLLRFTTWMGREPRSVAP